MKKKKIAIWLLILCCFNMAYWGIVLLLPSSIETSFTAFGIAYLLGSPILASHLTKKMTGDTETTILRIRTTDKFYLLVAVLLSIFAAVIGLMVYCILVPEFFNFSLENLLNWDIMNNPKELALYFNFLPIVLVSVLVFLSLYLFFSLLVILGWYSYFFPLLEQKYGPKKAGGLLGVMMGLQYFSIVGSRFIYSREHWRHLPIDLLEILLFAVSLSVCSSFFIWKTHCLLPAILFFGITVALESILKTIGFPSENFLCGIFPIEKFKVLGLLSISFIILVSKRLWERKSE